MPSSDQSIIQIHNMATGEVIHLLRPHGTRVSFVRFMGNLVGTAAWKISLSDPPLPTDSEIRLSDSNGKEVFYTKVDSARVYRLALSRDASMIAASIEQHSETGEPRYFIRIWNTATGKQIDEFPLEYWALALEFHPVNDLLTTIGCDTGDLAIRDVRRSITLTHQSNAAPEVQDLCCSPDGDRFAAATRRQVLLWNFESRR